jgi:hypothetical protein
MYVVVYLADHPPQTVWKVGLVENSLFVVTKYAYPRPSGHTDKLWHTRERWEYFQGLREDLR